MKILIADDSILIYDRVKEMLERFPTYRVLPQVRTSEEALRAIRKQQPDIAILDLILDQSNAFEILKEIGLERGGMTIVVITANNFPGYENRCRLLGADFFLEKMTQLDQLIEICRSESVRREQSEEKK